MTYIFKGARHQNAVETIAAHQDTLFSLFKVRREVKAAGQKARGETKRPPYVMQPWEPVISQQHARYISITLPRLSRLHPRNLTKA